MSKWSAALVFTAVTGIYTVLNHAQEALKTFLSRGLNDQPTLPDFDVQPDTWQANTASNLVPDVAFTPYPGDRSFLHTAYGDLRDSRFVTNKGGHLSESATSSQRKALKRA
jgi:hypothetical protein